MTNRFSHIQSPTRSTKSTLTNNVSQRETTIKGKPSNTRIGREAYDSLMSLLSLDTETPTTPYGVLIANSTKRNLRMQIEELFKP